jgi:hypothetical protein
MEALARPFGQKNKKKLFCGFELPNTPNSHQMSQDILALLNRYPGQAVFLAEQLGNASLDTCCHPFQMQALAAMSANTYKS